jgi:hypothetical protein
MIAPSARLAPTTDRRHYSTRGGTRDFLGTVLPFKAMSQSSPRSGESTARLGHGPVPVIHGRTENVAMCLHGPCDPLLLGYHGHHLSNSEANGADNSALVVGESSTGKAFPLTASASDLPTGEKFGGSNLSAPGTSVVDDLEGHLVASL